MQVLWCQMCIRDRGSGADGVPGQDSGARAGLIKDQTFQVSLIPLGDVTFASYGPDPAKNPLGDVVFRLEKDGQVIDTLEGVYGDNIRSNEIFNQMCIRDSFLTKCICDMNTNRCLLLGYIALDSGPLFCIYR